MCVHSPKADDVYQPYACPASSVVSWVASPCLEGEGAVAHETVGRIERQTTDQRDAEAKKKVSGQMKRS